MSRMQQAGDTSFEHPSRGDQRCAMVQGFSVHANVSIKTHDRAGLDLLFTITGGLLPVIVNIWRRSRKALPLRPALAHRPEPPVAHRRRPGQIQAQAPMAPTRRHHLPDPAANGFPPPPRLPHPATPHPPHPLPRSLLALITPAQPPAPSARTHCPSLGPRRHPGAAGRRPASSPGARRRPRKARLHVRQDPLGTAHQARLLFRFAP